MELVLTRFGILGGTLPETNSKFAPENRPFYPIGSRIVFQPSIFRGELAGFVSVYSGIQGFLHVKGGIGSIFHHPIGRKNTTYSPCLLRRLYSPYHLLREPETTIDPAVSFWLSETWWCSAPENKHEIQINIFPDTQCMVSLPTILLNVCGFCGL